MDGKRRHRFLFGLGALIPLLMIALLPQTDASADSCSDGDPYIKLTLSDLGLSTLDIFYLSDFRADTGSPSRPLFQFSVSNDGASDRSLVLTLQLDAETGPLFSASTYPFDVGAGQTISGTNQDLSTVGSMFELGVMDLTDGRQESLILRLGYLPEGEYHLRLSLDDATTATEISECFLQFTVINPRTVELILPGAEFEDMLPVENSPFPLFQWQSDAGLFDIRLCPVMPGDGSGEEVMGNEPVHENLGFYTEFTGTHTWLYPPGAESLAEGQSYCWQVEAIVPSSSGDTRFISEIFCFEMSSTTGAPDYDAILDLLMELLPPGALAEVLPQLAGLNSTGTITLNHETISSAEMATLLRSLLSAGWEVGSLEVTE
ncbi:MAG: hypothetical protein GY835_02065 [bacterium]|nr:hypothetical protein [bacterium]